MIRRWLSPPVSHRQENTVRNDRKRGEAVVMICPNAAKLRPPFQQRQRSHHHVCMDFLCSCPSSLVVRVKAPLGAQES